MRDLVIVGTGLLGEVVATYFRHQGRYRIVGFAADQSYAESTPTFLDLPVTDFASLPSHFPPGDCEVFIAVGFRDLNQIRARFFSEAKAMGYTCATYVHDSVVRWPETTFGENVFVFEDNTIQPFVEIGDDTILWSGNHIGHHSKVGAHCFITSHVVISGSCVIGDFTFCGVNAAVRDGVSIGERNIVGPGSLILKNTEASQVFLPKGTEPRGLPSHRVKL